MEFVLENWEGLGSVVILVVLLVLYVREVGMKKAFDIVLACATNSESSKDKKDEFNSWLNLRLGIQNRFVRMFINSFVKGDKLEFLLQKALITINAIAHMNKDKEREYENNKTVMVKANNILISEIEDRASRLSEKVATKLTNEIIDKAVSEDYFQDKNLIANDKLEDIRKKTIENVKNGNVRAFIEASLTDGKKDVKSGLEAIIKF